MDEHHSHAPGSGPRHRRARFSGLVAVATAAVLAAAGCAGGPSGDRGGVGELLTVALPAAPATLDPGKADQNAALFIQPAYDPLVRIEADGEFSPAIATEWGYVGSGNKAFEMTIRSGVRYSDGTDLGAATVRTYLEYARDSRGAGAGFLQGARISTPTAETVRIDLAKPYPLVPFMLSQYNVIGSPVSPTALQDPQQLGKSTAGAGPYRLDPDATVAGDHYTYVPNQHYWNPDGVHYEKIVIRVISNPNSTLNALRTNQVDVAVADLSIAAGAEAAGLTLTSTPLLFQGLVLADRGGEHAKPLGDLRVRQALNHAVDRAAVSRAVGGKYAVPTAQTVPEGSDAYVPELEERYDHDPAKARRMLAEAGYADGFRLDVLTTDVVGMTTMAQAVAGELAKVGVRVNLVNKENNTYAADLQAARYPAFAAALGAGPMAFEYAFLFGPEAPFNPFGTTHPELTGLTERMLTADEDDRVAVDQQIERFLVEQAWLLTVTFTPLVFYSDPGVGGIALSPKNPLATITDFHPKR